MPCGGGDPRWRACVCRPHFSVQAIHAVLVTSDALPLGARREAGVIALLRRGAKQAAGRPSMLLVSAHTTPTLALAYQAGNAAEPTAWISRQAASGAAAGAASAEPTMALSVHTFESNLPL
jgi:hypothetical protein